MPILALCEVFLFLIKLFGQELRTGSIRTSSVFFYYYYYYYYFIKFLYTLYFINYPPPDMATGWCRTRATHSAVCAAADAIAHAAWGYCQRNYWYEYTLAQWVNREPQEKHTDTRSQRTARSWCDCILYVRLLSTEPSTIHSCTSYEENVCNVVFFANVGKTYSAEVNEPKKRPQRLSPSGALWTLYSGVEYLADTPAHTQTSLAHRQCFWLESVRCAWGE